MTARSFKKASPSAVAKSAPKAAGLSSKGPGTRQPSQALLGQLPASWKSSDAAVKAVQIAFDVNEGVLEAVRRAAFDAGLSNSDQMRVVLGLPIVRHAKRPRLTMSLTDEDYALLGKRFQIAAEDRLSIKERAHQALVEFVTQKPAKAEQEQAKPKKSKTDKSKTDKSKTENARNR